MTLTRCECATLVPVLLPVVRCPDSAPPRRSKILGRPI
jgi:hypothetical protein